MTNTPSNLSAYVKATFAVLVWGASFIATKIALRDVSPMTIIWLRFGIGVFILGWFAIARRELAYASPREIGYFAMLGFIGITFHQWLQSNGLLTSEAATTAWIVTTTPVFIALLGLFVLREHLGWKLIGGIALAACGVLLVVSHGDLSSIIAGQFGSRGDVLILISAPNWAVFSVLSRRGLKTYSASQMMFYVMLFGWLFVSGWFFADNGWHEISRITFAGWMSLGFLGIFCSGFAYIFWYDALKAIPASRVGVLLYFEPLVAVAVAAALLNERITLVALAGGALVILGVWIVNRR